MMPGQPVAKGTHRFHIGVQCTCGGAMYYGRESGDLCAPGEMTCSNTECGNFGKCFPAPTVDVKLKPPPAGMSEARFKFRERARVAGLLNQSNVAVKS